MKFIFAVILLNHSLLLASPLPTEILTAFSDEFSQPADLLNNNTTSWQILGAGINDERASSIEINNGWLTVIPEVFPLNAWFEDEYGPLVYQEVTGNFTAVIHLRVVSTSDNNSPPNVGFNAGGFVIRDATGTHSGDENWVMYNMGGQGMNGVTYAREVKKTVNSTSNLFLTEQIGLEEYLLVCRIGQQFRFYYWADAIEAWREEHYYNQYMVDGIETTTWHNSSSATPEIVLPDPGNATPLFFNHPALPGTVQIGIMGHTWSNGDTQAEFDFIRFAFVAPVIQADCTVPFENLGIDLIFSDNFDL